MKVSTMIHVAVRTLEARVRKSLGLPPRPYKILLELTSLCNSRCTHCAIWKTDKETLQNELELEEFDRILSQAGKDLKWLALSGGEVTTYKNFPGLVELIRRHCPKLSLITFTTNGLMPKQALEYALLLRDYDLFVTVSLDGDAETHDRIRGRPGNHALALETLSLLKAAGIPAHYGLTVSGENSRFIENRYKNHSHEIKAVTFVHSEGIYAQTNTVNDAGVARSLETIAAAYRPRSLGEVLEKVYIELGVLFLRQGRVSNLVSCEVGHTSLHIRPDGALHACMFTPALGNLRKNSYREVLNSQRTNEQLKAIQAERCPRCWMNCYAPHSMLMHPIQSLQGFFGLRIKKRFENHPSVTNQDSAINHRHANQL